mmetsp:Transcript_25867/g.62110  ORF Transcript_25867/g.62110 Transcript_25867/m.62110 type:complete len:90 (+) Transcript_25867:844-1113(+)
MKDETSGMAKEAVDVGLTPLLRGCGARLDEDGSLGVDILMEMRLGGLIVNVGWCNDRAASLLIDDVSKKKILTTVVDGIIVIGYQRAGG